MCGGAGCADCGGGYIVLTSCPKRYAADVFDLLQFAEMYSKGLPPVSGGALDQSQWFLAACQRIWADEAYWRGHLARYGQTN